MNQEAVSKTVSSGLVHFFSRSRQSLWKKGETSGNTLELESIRVDCDNDTILIVAKPNGPTCHLGTQSCFDKTEHETSFGLHDLEELILERSKNPSPGSYTSELLESGAERISKKIGEESAEVIVEAVKNDPERLREEAADLLYHLLVLLRSRGVSIAEVEQVLGKRHQSSN